MLQVSKKGFIQGEVLRLLRTNALETKFEERAGNFKSNFPVRGYSDYLVNKLSPHRSQIHKQEVGT